MLFFGPLCGFFIFCYLEAMQIEELHYHYQLQAEWLADSRAYLYRRISLARRHSILDLGCGTGVISRELQQRSGVKVTALDISPELIEFASGNCPEVEFITGDELSLLKEKRQFDLIFLSFVLLWQSQPETFLSRLKQLLVAEGVLLIAAEPDYGARIDFPEQLEFLAGFFAETIRKQGGDPFIGRKLRKLTTKAGFRAEVDQFSPLIVPSTFDLESAKREWRIWGEWGGLSPREQRRIVAAEQETIAKGERLIVAPIFYAICRP